MKNWILLVHHDPALDPRVGWISSYSPKGINIKIVAFQQDGNQIFVQCGDKIKKINGNRMFDEIVFFMDDLFDTLNLQGRLQSERKHIEKFAFYTEEIIRFASLELEKDSQELLKKLKEEATLILSCNHALIKGAINETTSPSGIISSDFYTLLAGVYLKLLWNCPLIYEAHEYHSEESPNYPLKFKTFIKEIEKNFLTFTDQRFIVTKELGQIAQKEFGLPFNELLNAVPFSGPK